MRTSRLSRDTARVVHALSPSKRSTRSLRSFAHDANPDEPPGSESELSSPPSSPNGQSLGKRKRGTTETPATSTTSISVGSKEVRRSPRKAITAEDASKKRKAKRQPAKRIKKEDGTDIVEPPANWEEVYNTTKEIRKRILAPVDTMGCESLAEETRSPRDQRLQTLISLMLSSQTKDPVTAAAIKNLQENLPGGLCLEALLEVDPARLNELIMKVGFHNNKTKYIKATALLLRDNYHGDIPDTIEGLVSLPGVGPKMAYLCMSAAWGRDEGIGVDVHVHRITNLWGWHQTSTPEQTRAELESWLPREKWHEINHLLVGFGQMVCLPVGRRCGECELGERGLCPSRVAGASPRKRKVKQEVKVEEGDGVVKKEGVVGEADDQGVEVEIKREDLGEVKVQGRIPDIEDAIPAV
ncbi:hypothetical protein PRZ48_001716 [Zasmidium cellare]|uniref:Endonuclease III homolog n=1 Tax=Zasmidium cellare TaxID=395010 RepID=A0ABR0F3U5_ZASCE|nr:hypothetical protein PRZ48_001716 [Zasmidium cellare]